MIRSHSRSPGLPHPAGVRVCRVARRHTSMDVQCERCKTEYEFDDALVSGKGTTVKCTNCGHQFKIRKASESESLSDRWTVQTKESENYVFTSLRELQR